MGADDGLLVGAVVGLIVGNAFSPIKAPSGTVILVRPVQPSNAPRPIYVTLSGITMLVRLVQP